MWKSAIDASIPRMKRRKVKFAIEESDQEIRKIFSDQSMKVFRSKNGTFASSNSDPAPRRSPSFLFRPTTPSIHSCLDRTFSAFYVSRTYEIRRKGGTLGWRVPGRKGDFRVFRRTTDNLFVARKDEALGREKFDPSTLLPTRYPPRSLSLSPRAVTYLTRPRDGSTLRRECASSFPPLRLRPSSRSSRVRGSNRSTVLLPSTSNLCAWDKEFLLLPSPFSFSSLETWFRATNRITRRGNWLISRRGRLPAR